MRALRSAALVCLTLALACGASFAQDASLPPDLMRVLLQAKSVYVVSGHVRYLKTKAFVKSEIVDSTPFDEPCRNELEKWGRFNVVPDVKSADLIIRVSLSAGPHSTPAAASGVPTIVTGAGFIVLDVVQPSSKKILWSAYKNAGTSWSTKTAVAGLMKKFREYIEADEKSIPASNAG